MNIAKRNRQNLLALAKKHEKEAIAKVKLALLPEREAVRSEIPYTSWQDFLKLEAWQQRNSSGRAALPQGYRSTETALEQAQPAPSSPAKDWSKHGLDYTAAPSTTRAEIRAEYAEKERELQERQDISASGRKQLQAYLRMEQVAAEARAAEQIFGEIKRRIDGKGVVIFTLPSGGSIRDTGKKIFYSGHDSKGPRNCRVYAPKNGENVFPWK